VKFGQHNNLLAFANSPERFSQASQVGKSGAENVSSEHPT
jgi:hypothetical protein